MAGRPESSFERYSHVLLPRTAGALSGMYKADALPGAPDGNPVVIHKHARISPDQGAALHKLILTDRLHASMEIGMAYGFSTLWILDAVLRQPNGSHLAIDPAEMSHWSGVGVEAVKRLDCGSRFELIRERSDYAIACFAKQEKIFDFVFIDGNHRFDDVLVDFYLSDQVLAERGIVVFHDTDMPSIKSVVSFVERNRSYERVRTAAGRHMVAFRKLGNDSRDWRHFVPFEARNRPPGRLRRAAARLRQLFQ